MSQERIIRNTLNSALSRLPAGGAPGLATLRDNVSSPMFRGLQGRRMALALLEQAKLNRRRAPATVFSGEPIHRLTEFGGKLTPQQRYENEQFIQSDLESRRTHVIPGALVGAGIGAAGGGFLGHKLGKRLGDSGRTSAIIGGGLGMSTGIRAGGVLGRRIRKDKEDPQHPAIRDMIKHGFPHRKNFSSNMNTTARLISLNARLDREVAFARRPQDEESTGSKIAKGAAIAAGVGGLAYGGTALGRGVAQLKRAYAPYGGTWGQVASHVRADPGSLADAFVSGARKNNSDIRQAAGKVTGMFRKKGAPLGLPANATAAELFNPLSPIVAKRRGA